MHGVLFSICGRILSLNLRTNVIQRVPFIFLHSLDSIGCCCNYLFRLAPVFEQRFFTHPSPINYIICTLLGVEADNTLKRIHDHPSDIIHIQSLQRSKWTFHSQQFKNGLIFPLQAHDEVSFPRFFLVNFYAYGSSMLGKILLYLSSTSFKYGSLFTCFDGEDFATRRRRNGGFLGCSCG